MTFGEENQNESETNHTGPINPKRREEQDDHLC